MLDTDRESLAKDIMALVVQGAEPAQVRQQAWEAKRRLTDDYFATWRTLNLIDQLVVNYGGIDPSWQFGFLVAQDAPATAIKSTSPAPAASARGERVLAIAAAMVNEGARTVTGREIAKRLRRDGDETAEKDLATGVGNILARSPRWRRVRPGEYEPSVGSEGGTRGGANEAGD